MKKTLSVILAVLLMFSTVSVMAFAEDATEVLPSENMVKVYFYLDEANLGGDADYVIEIEAGGKLATEIGYTEDFPDKPEKAATDTAEYTFRYWEEYTLGEDGNWIATGNTHYTYTLPNIPADAEDGSEIYYVAIYNEELIFENMSFWALITYIFSNFNKIFEYLAKIYEGVF